MSVLIIDGIRVEFPYEAYECQQIFMEKVISALKTKENAALESPTGTGKTLCLLCAAIAFVKELKTKITVNAEGEIQGASKGCLYPRILYTSRTHSQLAQVVRELNKTIYRDTPTVTLGSRDMLCVNEKVQREPNVATKSLACRVLVRQRKCHFYNELEKKKDDTLDVLFSEGGRVPDIEDLLKNGKKHSMCPFYYVRSQFEKADLILLPYNYVVDPRLRQTHGIKLEGNIVIFDEAHNLESVCEESVSVSLSSTEISGCIRGAKMVLQAVVEDEEALRTEMDNTELPFGQKSSEEKKETLLDKNNVALLLEKLYSFEEDLDKMGKSIKNGEEVEDGRLVGRLSGRVFPGRKMVELLNKADFRRNIRDEVTLLIDHICQYLAHKASEAGGLTSWNEKGVHLQQFAAFMSTVFADSYDSIFALDESRARRKPAFNKGSAADNFQLYMTVSEDDELKLNYWCFSPAVAMRYLFVRGVRSIIATSGTLSPLDTFVGTLGIEVPIRLENPHVARKEQLLAAAIRADAKGNLICGTYSNRSKEEYLLGVGSIVERVCAVVPEGVLVFFPSYTVMNLCISKWKMNSSGPSLWTRMSRSKKLFEEPKSKAEVKLVMVQFREAVTQEGGATLFAVCRAKVSEGIDFSDSESRAVVVVGIPFAPSTDARVELKKQFLTDARTHLTKVEKRGSRGLSAEEWYQVDAVRAVNQAMGRVLRHKDDFGIVLLADSRYFSMDTKRFPSWFRDSVQKFEKFEEFEPICCRFFRDFGLKPNPGPSYLPAPPTFSRSVSLNPGGDAGLVSHKRKAVLPSGANPLAGPNKRPKALSQYDVLDNIRELYGGTASTSTGRPTVAETGKSIGVQKGSSGGVGVARTGSVLARIEELNVKDSGHERAPVMEIEILCGPSTSASRSTATKKIRLKPNSSLQLSRAKDEEGMKALEQCRRSPKKFVHLLGAMSVSHNQKNVMKALTEYSSKKNFDVFVKELEKATLPAYPEIFKGVFGLLDVCHKAPFVSECRRRGLL